MKAWTFHRYGGPEVLSPEDIAFPAVKPDEVLIRVVTTTISSGDSRIRAMRLPRGFGLIGRLIFGWNGPRQPVLGTEVAGIIEAVGEKVRHFHPGEAVIAFRDTRMGCHASHVTMPEGGMILHKPDSLTFEEAASLCFGGLTAHDYIRKAGLVRGERLLVLGASGTVGSSFVQQAKAMGVHVTAMASKGNIALLREIGADSVIDYQEADFTQLGQQWDVIADCVATSHFKACLPVLKEGGRYLSLAGSLLDMLAFRKGSRRSISGPAASSLADLQALLHLAETGAYKPLIDSVYPLDQMREAHARTDSGRKRGSVVVRFSHP